MVDCLKVAGSVKPISLIGSLSYKDEDVISRKRRMFIAIICLRVECSSAMEEGHY